MSGVKGKSGRLGYRARAEKSLQVIGRHLPILTEALLQRAEAGDKDCLLYCFDRILGKPRQEIDQNIRGLVVSITADKLAELELAWESEQRQLLEPVIEAEVIEIPTTEAKIGSNLT